MGVILERGHQGGFFTDDLSVHNEPKGAWQVSGGVQTRRRGEEGNFISECYIYISIYYTIIARSLVFNQDLDYRGGNISLEVRPSSRVKYRPNIYPV